MTLFHKNGKNATIGLENHIKMNFGNNLRKKPA